MPRLNSEPTIDQVRRREKINELILKSAAIVVTAIITFMVLSFIS